MASSVKRWIISVTTDSVATTNVLLSLKSAVNLGGISFPPPISGHDHGGLARLDPKTDAFMLVTKQANSVHHSIFSVWIGLSRPPRKDGNYDLVIVVPDRNFNPSHIARIALEAFLIFKVKPWDRTEERNLVDGISVGTASKPKTNSASASTDGSKKGEFPNAPQEAKTDDQILACLKYLMSHSNWTPPVASAKSIKRVSEGWLVEAKKESTKQARADMIAKWIGIVKGKGKVNGGAQPPAKASTNGKANGKPNPGKPANGTSGQAAGKEAAKGRKEKTAPPGQKSNGAATA